MLARVGSPSSRGDDGGEVSRTRGTAAIGRILGAPAVLAACVLALVTSVGVFSTASSYAALERAGRKRAETWLATRAAGLRASLGEAFGVADPLLDRLAVAVRASPSSAEAAQLVPTLLALTSARRGLAWTSVSYPDGTFVGVQYEGERVRAEESRVTPAGTYERTLDLDAEGRVRELARAPTTYDPRERGFYRLAVARRTRAWTEPYPFVPTLTTGVSRVAPLYAREGDPASLIAVLTVDFDAIALTRLLDAPIVPGHRTIVVTADGVLLGERGARHGESARDPVVRAMVELVTGARRETTFTRALDVDGEAVHVLGTRVASLDAQPILLVTSLPERALHRDAIAQARRGVLATGAMALVGVGFAFVLSSSIARLREQRTRAEHAARRAHAEARELGAYTLLGRIGVGAMGEVYRARHTLLARDAALKLIKVEDDDDDARLEERHALFFEEARRLASLHSLHTVSVLDFGVADDGRWFLAMELLHGLDLDALVRRYGPQPPARVAAILAQVCDALAEAHAHGLVHQDVKPANVFLCRIAEALDFVKVLDFGLSRAVSAGRARRLEGTPAYMSPEQILGEPLTPSADLYALGGLGFFLLTGRPPYPGRDRDALFDAHVNAPLPTLPDDVLRATPPGLAQILTRCLAKRPEHRPTSAAVLARVLHDIAETHAASFSDDARAAWWAKFEDERPTDDERAMPQRVAIRADGRSLRGRSVA